MRRHLPLVALGLFLAALPLSGSDGETGKSDQGPLAPELDVYLPEGELDFRLSGLIKGAFYEGQIRYDFVDGDILAFLRYRYYGYRRIYQLGLFDSVEFEDLEDGSGDFERVRGGLLLVQWPHTIHHRTFLLAEIDDITTNKEDLRFSNDSTNTFVRLGFQIGTPADDRSNALLGANRGRRRRLFTAHREIGPAGAGLTAAFTWSFDDFGGDFDYQSLELEGLKRFDLTDGSFVIGRIHGGTFLAHGVLRDGEMLAQEDTLAVPRNELFRLDGRDNLKGIDEELVGTHELHTTFELFVPWFRDDHRRGLGVEWDTWYWVLYSGYGAIGFERRELYESSNYIPDLGLGFEASFRLRKQSFFLSGVVAHAVDDVGGFRSRLAIKSYR